MSELKIFPVTHWERSKEEAEVLSPYSQKLRITALGRSVSTPIGGIKGYVVRFPSFKALKKAPLKGYIGKIIFVDEPMGRSRDGSGYSKAVEKRYLTGVEAGKRGAIAALIRSVGTDHHRFPHTGQMDSYKEGIKKVPVAALSAPDADQLQRLMKKDAIQLRLNIQTISKGEKPSGNVIGEVPGETDEIVLIGAHLDSWDLGTGAVDDGAGVGIVMAAAKIILDQKKKPKRTIRVVLFGAEEVGLIGAKAYAKQHATELSKHFLASESDFGAGKIWRFDTRFEKDQLGLQDIFSKNLSSLGIKKGHNEAYGGPDLIPLFSQGVPVFGLKQDGMDYFDLHHTEDDTFDKINKADLQQNVAAWAAMTWMGAQLETPISKLKIEKK